MKLDISKITTWNVASKTKNISAKPIFSVMVDRTVTNKFLVDCLEGREPIRDGSLICVGEAGDAWQQMPGAFLSKYKVIKITDDGWMIGEPLPGNAVNCFEITQEFIDSHQANADPASQPESRDHYIIGSYGESAEDGLRQYCSIGDFICQSRTDSSDNWIVSRKIFLNTYIIKS